MTIRANEKILPTQILPWYDKVASPSVGDTVSQRATAMQNGLFPASYEYSRPGVCMDQVFSAGGAIYSQVQKKKYMNTIQSNSFCWYQTRDPNLYNYHIYWKGWLSLLISMTYLFVFGCWVTTHPWLTETGWGCKIEFKIPFLHQKEFNLLWY